MKLIAIAAVLAVIGVPIAVQGEPAPTKSPSTRRVCTVQSTLGTRLGNTRRCRTEDEREKEKEEVRQVVERIQSFKATMCAAPRPTC